MKDFLRLLAYGSVFAVPFVLLWVSSSMFFPYITGKNFAFRILVEIAFASWLVLALCDRMYRPRWSALIASVGSLIAIMLVADLFGEYAHKSIWSNYERMEGWITLLHFGLYFLVAGTLINTEKLWKYFFNTALVAAVLMSLYSLGQISGAIEVSQGGSWRIYGQLGNSSYLGIYMVFHMFIAGWMYLQAKTNGWRWLYGGLFALFVYIMLHTGTRGAALGVLGGAVLTFLYLALMAPKGAAIKKWAVGGVLALVLLAGGLVAAKNTSFVANSEILSRLANISLEEGNIRFIVWQTAYEGFKERPLLGWGQENFSYVFTKYYDSELYRAEPWYDRTHNIFFDWLIAGGILGLLAYLSMLVVALYYAVLQPLWARFKTGKTVDEYFTVYEQALLLGLLAAYTFNNLFVFDNLASWIFYAVTLAFVHSRVAKSWPRLERGQVSEEVVWKVVTPVVAVMTIFIIYVVNVPGISAARSIIDVYQATSTADRIEHLRAAFNSGTFADQEVVEQMAQVGGKIIASENLSATEKAAIKQEVVSALQYLEEKKAGDARIHVIGALFYRMIGDYGQALVELRKAEELAPQKQATINEQAAVHMLAGQYDKAVEAAARSYHINENNREAMAVYAAALLYTEDTERLAELITIDEFNSDIGLQAYFLRDAQVLQAAYQTKNYDWLLPLAEAAVRLEPQNVTSRINLASVYAEMGDKEAAREVIRQAMVDIPTFRPDGEKLLQQI